MNLKLTEQGTAAVEDGKVIAVRDDGTEVAIDVIGLYSKIPALNEEAKKHRLSAKEATDKLAAFEGLDADAARKALETVANLDAKKLVDAGEVEKVKAEVAKAYEAKLAKAQETAEGLSTRIHDLTVGNAFRSSPLFAGDDRKTIYPPEHAQRIWGDRFRDEDGKLVAVDPSGAVIYSRKNAGEPAEFDEALEILLENEPRRDAIFRAGKPGTGSGGGGHVSNTKPWNRLSPQEKAAFMAEHSHEEVLARVQASMNQE